MGQKKFTTLVDQMSPERQGAVRARTTELLQEMVLQELRQALKLTQEELAGRLGIKQASLSKLERQDDMRISTMQKLLQSMGAELVLVARFPDEDVQISQFKDAKAS